MQLRYRLHEAQAEADARSAAARVAAIETLHDLAFFRIPDSRAVVRYGDLGRAVAAFEHGNLDGPVRMRTLQRVVDQIAQGLSEQNGFAEDRHRTIRSKCRMD